MQDVYKFSKYSPSISRGASVPDCVLVSSWCDVRTLRLQLSARKCSGKCKYVRNALRQHFAHAQMLKSEEWKEETDIKHQNKLTLNTKINPAIQWKYYGSYSRTLEIIMWIWNAEIYILQRSNVLRVNCALNLASNENTHTSNNPHLLIKTLQKKS